MAALSSILLAAGLAAGAGKGISASAKESKQRKLAAETQRYSPWTGLQAQPIQQADVLGSIMQGGMTGASLGQGIENMDYQRSLTGPGENVARNFSPGVSFDQSFDGTAAPLTSRFNNDSSWATRVPGGRQTRFSY